MAHFSLTLPAQEDLDAIWSYIARDNRTAADRLIQRLYELCELYAT